ncbi:hypothetical protein HanIR_Chr17g0853111 [Helianthus annuus]|nr:hypothetical protein HanIR_Chr17g0853111 [Helianthus annuus]
MPYKSSVCHRSIVVVDDGIFLQNKFINSTVVAKTYVYIRIKHHVVDVLIKKCHVLCV